MITILQQRTHRTGMKAWLKFKGSLGLDQHLDTYYFGYGANLSIERFKKWHIPAEIVGSAYIDNHQLKFNLPCEYKGKGFAGVEECQGKRAWGILFKVNSKALKMLDVLEWVHFNFYERKLLKVICNGETFKDVHSYVPCFPKAGLKPSKGYLDFIIQSGTRANFPEEYLRELSLIETAVEFDLDTSFYLRNPSKRRVFCDELSIIYQTHDNVREKLTRLIP